MTAASEPMLACGDKEPRKALQMYSLTARPAGVTAALSVHAGQYEPCRAEPSVALLEAYLWQGFARDRRSMPAVPACRQAWAAGPFDLLFSAHAHQHSARSIAG